MTETAQFMNGAFDGYDLEFEDGVEKPPIIKVALTQDESVLKGHEVRIVSEIDMEKCKTPLAYALHSDGNYWFLPPPFNDIWTQGPTP